MDVRRVRYPLRTRKPRRLAGVDGCPAGWIVAMAAAEGASHRLELCAGFADVLRLAGPSAVVAVDMPIGLLDERRPGGRACDAEARRLLGPRRSSIFSPPSRDALYTKDWSEARRCGLNRQGFNIAPKIRELDEWMTPTLQRRVVESHPELAFAGLAGAPMRFNKKTAAGRRERLAVLRRSSRRGPCRVFERVDRLFEADRARFLRRDAASDDIVDAYTMLMVAARLAAGTATRVPAAPPVDRRGLRMEIWY